MDGLPYYVPAAVAFASSLLVTALVARPIRNLAARIDFYDRPIGYKQHRIPTPYLGGVAVLSGFLVGTVTLGSSYNRFLPLTLCAIGLLAVGTLDDRVGLGIAPRLAAQLAAALALWLSGLGWELGSEATDLALTLLWVVGVTNALNLMDNLDGAAGTVGATCAAGVGILAINQGDAVLAAYATALAGACVGFLPHNLARPSRIFLGDGGSMPIGFLLAGMVMSFPQTSLGLTALLASAPLVGLPILDTTLVVVSRSRRGVSIFAGGRDHITHRLLPALGSEQRVSWTLAVAQGLLCGLSLLLHHLDSPFVVAGSVAYALMALGVIAFLESPFPAHAEIANKGPA